MTITVGAVGADANVGVAATGPGAPVAIGTPFAYTLNVSNAGPAAASNVRLTDTLPEGTQFVSATTTAGTCQHANGTLLCNLGTLGSGAAATIVLNVRPTIGGPHTNQRRGVGRSGRPRGHEQCGRQHRDECGRYAVHDRLLLGPDELTLPARSAWNLERLQGTSTRTDTSTSRTDRPASTR